MVFNLCVLKPGINVFSITFCKLIILMSSRVVEYISYFSRTTLITKWSHHYTKYIVSYSCPTHVCVYVYVVHCSVRLVCTAHYHIKMIYRRSHSVKSADQASLRSAFNLLPARKILTIFYDPYSFINHIHTRTRYIDVASKSQVSIYS